MKILFKTVHGSRLYGLHHEHSDWDYYTVVDRVEKKKAAYSTHEIIDGVDSVVVDFGTWINSCQKGVPQALEAMFSQKAEIDLIPEFRAAFTSGRDFSAYRRTINHMCDIHDDFKHKRHMLRLALNLRSLRQSGRFNPTLNEGQVKGISMGAERWSAEECLDFSQRLAYSDLLVLD